MADPAVIQPDTEFLGRLLASGGGDLKKCYQCATCSVACELSQDAAPFPRPQMAAAQWGLKDRLISDPAIWFCHNCGKCTERCPRGARPGDVLGAVRREAIRHFAFPRFLGDWVANPKMLPLLFLIPALIFTAVLLWAPKPNPAPAFEFASLFPASVLEPLFFAISGFALLAFVIGIARFARGLSPGEGTQGLPPALADVATNRRFSRCEHGEEPDMRLAHLLTFWGFMGLALVGTSAGIGTLAGVLHTPLSLTSPLKIFANFTALMTAIGVTLLVVRRMGRPAPPPAGPVELANVWREPVPRDPGAVARRTGTYFDWFFLATLAAVIFTGIASEILRLAQTRVMYGVYFIHLVLVFGLMLYAPYSKFAHLAYRTVALAKAAKLPQRS